jgi:hypothetical protein
MTMRRYVFPISCGDSGVTVGDTGKAFFGKLHQIGWAPTVADTGGALVVVLCPVDGDTAGGFTIVNDEDALRAPGFLYSPSIGQTQVDGFDTGVQGEGRVPVVGAGDHLRIKATSAAAATQGKLYFWVDED